MKIAVDFQSGPRITALTRIVTHSCPALTRAGGCSLTRLFGTIQETFGSLPRRAALKTFVTEVTFLSWPPARTVVNHGNGFQIPGVFALWWRLLQNRPPSSLH